MPDIFVDSLSTPEASFSTSLRGMCTEAEAPAMNREEYVTGRPSYIRGVLPTPRPAVPSHDSTVALLLLALFLFVAVNFKHYSVFLKTFSQELLSVRRRANAFDEHTVSETRVLVSMILMVCFGETFLLFSAIYVPGCGLPVFPLVVSLLAVAIAYYVVQLMAYSVVGHVFTDSTGALQWVKGFNASQSLLGITLIIPSLVALFYPAWAPTMIAIGCALYLLARIIFICKGFKIFYHNLFSLVYFILYLCTLEIAPLVFAYRLRYIIV